jgi:integrase
MGNGTIYRRGNSWCVGFTVNGRRVRETVGPNKKIAQKVLSLRMTQVLENRYFPPNRQLGRMPFKDFAQMYLEREGPLLKSIRTERNRVLAWAREFGSRPLGQITREEIEAWRRNKMTKCRPATINRDLSRLRRMFSLAVEWELLEESPMAGIRFLRENNARTRYLSIEECQRLIASCIAPHIRALVTVALHSGMRLGEILNLRWYDLDFASGFILVRDSKNGESRHVPMDATLFALFRAYPRRLGTDLVFCSSSGRRIVDVRTGFLNACKRAGLTDLHFHDLRHTFASQFVMAGGGAWVLREILGHKSLTISLRYTHLAPTYKIKAIDRMNTLWAGATPQTSTSRMLPENSSVTPASQATYDDAPVPAQTRNDAGLSI